MYVRTLKQSQVKNISKFMSLKNDSIIRTESMLEFDMCFHLEYSPDVVSFESQPQGFYYEYQGKHLPYTPDFLITHSSGRQQLLEIKPLSKTQRPDFQSKFIQKQQAAQKLNLSLILITEKQIRTGHLLNNFKLLHRYSGLHNISATQKSIINLIQTVNKIQINQIANRLNISNGEVLAGVLSWQSKGVLQTVYTNEIINGNSIVSLGLSMDIEFPFTDEFQKILTTQSSPAEITNDKKTEVLTPSLDSYDDAIKAEVLRRISFLKWIKPRLKGGWTEKNLTPLLNDASIDLKAIAPKWRTLAEWHKNYHQSGEKVSSLIPKHSYKGNKHMNTDGDFLITKAINEKYLTLNRCSISQTFKYYCDLVIIENRSILTNKIKKVSQRTFYNRINALPKYDVALKRYGKRYADIHYRKVGKMLEATRPLEYVEIDHTPLDLILLDDTLEIPLGRPYLTILIDSYSKCIVGYNLSFRPPSFESIRHAFCNACLDKSLITQQYPHLQHDWPVAGKIENLVVDNGAEFWSDSLEDSLLPFATNILYNKVGEPWMKPLVEKFFDLLNKGLVHSLPGTTRSRIEQLKGYNPKKDATITFSLFLDLFYTWIIDIYHMTSDARETAVPYFKWQEGVTALPPLTYTDEEAQQLRIELGILNTRTVRIGGIFLHGLRYESEELSQYRKIWGAIDKNNLTLKTKTDPSDISHIFVYLTNESRYIKVPCITDISYTSGLTLFQHQTAQKLQRTKTRLQIDHEKLADSRMYVENRIAEEVEKIKSSKKRTTKTTHASKIARHQDIGSHTQKSIQVPNEQSEIKKLNKNEHDVLNGWDELHDDLEGF
ncbi:TnsA endonuclease N-terminal domain-containing protein [Aliivibrio sp. S2TY2]|uniref:TnsA endonuclease N-terminal domain-containing protein n=1 Tax=unclassified Aliivibrio TaxID=2645654 RepID=UPI0023799D82|nr:MULTISPECIES: TnsA endonuclease N-terminal domain-containing protein [unclassified Aliivibrio]MDD9173522.1 TnsA endonuclease N-terminal domain-containing protein [Aliivibrio sp. S3TY1]MDD9190598.1 TnsA endonuclease N-terminal domain-containing protein [Aliivibrio sp. S2TY2]